MAQSRDESPPSRIELVVLACLSQSTPPSDAELGEAVQELALPGESVEATRRRAHDLLVELVRRAWVTGDDAAPQRGKQRKSEPPRTLTEIGKRVLRNAFHLARAPTWAQVRDKHLPALALEGASGAELAAKTCTESALMAAVLCVRFGVRGAATPRAVYDALIADALGMPRGGRLTLGGMRAHVLARGIDRQARDAPSPSAKDYPAKLAAWIACSAVGASGKQRNKVARALARRWVCEEANPLGVVSVRAGAPATAVADMATPPAAPPVPATAAVASPPQSAEPAASPARNGKAQPPEPVAAAAAPPQRPAGPAASPPRDRATQSSVADAGARPRAASDAARSAALDGRVAPPAADLLEVVRETIPRVGAEGRFGEKVYVSAIWRTIERDRKAGDLSLDHFKRWLVRANRDGWLVLARADLIGAMDARQVNESEINDRGATFHFVLDQRNGASVSQPESHAG